MHKITAPASATVYRCQNCDFSTHDESHLEPISDVTERVSPGEVMPHGECPDCGALVHADTTSEVPTINEHIEATVIANLIARGWQVKPPSDLVVIDPAPHPGDWDKHDSESFEAYAARVKLLYDRIPAKHIWMFPFADGYALYRVYDETPLRLQHIPYGDAWRAPQEALAGINAVALRKQCFGSS